MLTLPDEQSQRESIREYELEKITFGRSVAEQETKELPKYFLPTHSYLNATKEHNKKTFYVGHRGSGKSAIFNQLSKYYSENGNNIILEIKPAEYSYETFKSIKHDFYNIRTAYGIAWELTMNVQIFKSVVDYFETKKNLKSNRQNVQIIKSYLIENNYLEKENGYSYGIGILIDFLRKISTSKQKISIHKNSSNDRNEKEFVKILNKDGMRKPLKALRQILDKFSIYIFIDELDKGWNNTEEARNFINGLIVSVSEIEKNPSVDVFLSIREDMFKNLSEIFDDAEKIRGNIEKIEWKERHLKHIIEKRVKASFTREKINIPDNYSGDLINLVFKNDALEYIISHTLKRPREIIHFCNLALEAFKKLPSSSDVKESKISIEVIKLVEDEFSNGRLDDFLEEYKYEYPKLSTLINSFENGNEYYSIEDFKDILESATIEFMEEHQDLSWLERLIDKSIIPLVSLLFRIGFIKVYIESKENYLASYDSIPIRNIKNIRKVKINDVFCPALKCC